MASTLPHRQPQAGTNANANATANTNLEVNPGSRTTPLPSGPSSRAPSAMSQARIPPPSRSPHPPPTDPYRSSDGSSKTTSSAVSSLQSSLSVKQPARINGTQRKRPLKSQYPRGSDENHVEYILVASFHIDRGPIMEHQYPGAISGDENMLAELMLPDQAHVRNQDWTIFFLHKDTSTDEDDGDDDSDKKKKRKKRRKEAGEKDQDTDDGSDDTTDEDESAEPGSEDEEDDEEEEEAEGGEGPPLIYVLNLVNTKQDTTAKRYDSHAKVQGGC